MRMQYDIIAFQLEGVNIMLAQTPGGHEWLAQAADNAHLSFLEFISTVPSELRVAVLDPTGKMLNFRSGVLH